MTLSHHAFVVADPAVVPAGRGTIRVASIRCFDAHTCDAGPAFGTAHGPVFLRRMHALAGSRVAGIERTLVPVVTVHGCARTDASGAVVLCGAQVAVGADRTVRERDVEAGARRRVAGVGRAAFVVVADRGGGGADAGHAHVARGAKVSVIALPAVGDGGVGAAGRGIAGVGGALVGVAAL